MLLIMIHTRSTVAKFILDNSVLLLAGTIAAVVWANIDQTTYDRVADPLHFWVNDVGMVFFFALAAKEVFEATLPEGRWLHCDVRCRRSQRPSVEWRRQH